MNVLERRWAATAFCFVLGMLVGAAVTYWIFGTHTNRHVYVLALQEHDVPPAFYPRGDVTRSWVEIWVCTAKPNFENHCPQNEKSRVLVTSKKASPREGRVYDGYDFQIPGQPDRQLNTATRDLLTDIVSSWIKP
jgi:hypothetical protein